MKVTELNSKMIKSQPIMFPEDCPEERRSERSNFYINKKVVLVFTIDNRPTTERGH